MTPLESDIHVILEHHMYKAYGEIESSEDLENAIDKAVSQVYILFAAYIAKQCLSDDELRVMSIALEDSEAFCRDCMGDKPDGEREEFEIFLDKILDLYNKISEMRRK